MSEGDLEGALQGLSEALARLLDAFRVTPDPDHPWPIHLGEGDDGRKISRHLTDHDQELARLRRDVDLLRSGIDHRRLQAFREFTPAAMIMAAGNAVFVSVGSEPAPTEQSVRFCYDFVVETALQLQAQRDSIESILRQNR